jgi:hypothetical protein
MNIRSWLARSLFPAELRAEARAALAAETDNTFAPGARALWSAERDRQPYDREEVLAQALEAWRVNPLARRIVELTTQYVVGGGVAFTCKHAPTQAFLTAFWEHPLNRMAVRVNELCDELTRAGDLFLLLSTDASGMSYVRALPAAQVKEIIPAPNDLEQAQSIVVKACGGLAEQTYPVYDPQTDAPDASGRFSPVALHYCVNRPAGAQWGESDLAPILRWLSRYSGWLEDRARLNRYRTAFLYIVRARFASEADRLARQAAINAVPPAPGSILVTDENENWDIISAKLEGPDASPDGLALKKMIAAGAGVPLHFLAEPESATRTTAEAAGGPTYRRYEQRQQYFTWLLADLLQTAASRRALVDRRISRHTRVEVGGADISVRDNTTLAQAARDMLGVLTALRDRALIDDAEMLRLAYRFCGETLDVQDMLSRARTGTKP